MGGGESLLFCSGTSTSEERPHAKKFSHEQRGYRTSDLAMQTALVRLRECLSIQ